VKTRQRAIQRISWKARARSFVLFFRVRSSIVFRGMSCDRALIESRKQPSFVLKEKKEKPFSPICYCWLIMECVLFFSSLPRQHSLGRVSCFLHFLVALTNSSKNIMRLPGRDCCFVPFRNGKEGDVDRQKKRMENRSFLFALLSHRRFGRRLYSYVSDNCGG